MASESAPRKNRVLVVDDESSVADTLAQILNFRGYEAASVYSLAQAFAWLESNGICDAVISDVVMDGAMSGIDLAIKLGSVSPQCKVLLISGNNLTADLLKAAGQQGHTFKVLPKPVHPDVILQRLRDLMD